MRPGLTGVYPSMRVGLLGGSFDPPHMGHVNISLEALKQLNLQKVYWLVSPGNPLKPIGPADLDLRLTTSEKIMRHPKVEISAIEARLKTRFTAHTLRSLLGRHPNVHFVWLMGADNLATIHKWQEWRWIMANVPIGVLARPGERMKALNSKAARTFRKNRLKSRNSFLLPKNAPPSWCFFKCAHGKYVFN